MTPALILGAVSVAVGAAGAWTVQSWRYDARVADIQRTHAEATTQRQAIHIKQLEVAREQIEKYQQRAQQAQGDASVRMAGADAALRRNRTELERLRDAIRARPVATCAMPDAATAASSEPADAAGDVLAECAAMATELARAADGHVSDVKMMIDASAKP